MLAGLTKNWTEGDPFRMSLQTAGMLLIQLGLAVQLLEWQELLWVFAPVPSSAFLSTLGVFLLPAPSPLPFFVYSATFLRFSAGLLQMLAHLEWLQKCPQWPPWIPQGAPGGKKDYGLHLGPPDAQVASPFLLLQHADELCINEHNIPLVLTAALCQESQMKAAALFAEMPLEAVPVGQGVACC